MSERTAVYLRGLPTRVVREAKAAAARRGSTLAGYVTESLERSLREGESPEGSDAEDLRESRQWYEKHRRDLLSRHRGEYVAIVGRAVVDHDPSFPALASRVFARLGRRAVFMPLVQEGGARARVRSPRRSR